MGEKLRENTKGPNPYANGQALPSEDEGAENIGRPLTQEEAFTLITKSFVAIAASLDTFAFIAEKYALKAGIITEKDLEEG